MLLRQASYLKEVMRQQWMGRREIEKFQLSALKSIVYHAYLNVPFYHESFRKKGIMPSDIKSLSDIKKLPVITRYEIDSNHQKFIAKNYREYYDLKDFIKKSTSGSSSGRPLIIPFDHRAYDYLEVIYARALFSEGYSPFKPLAYYWYEPFAHKPMNFFGLMRKQLISHTLTEEEQIKLLEKLKPEFIHYFSSSIYNISRIISDKSLEKIRPKAIITHAEILSKRMRKRIEDTFNTEVFDQYGSTEFNRMAWECKEHNYHLDADSMITEFLSGNNDCSSGEEGNVVVTGLANYFFPLIRYSIEDKATPEQDECSCGRGLPTIKGISGRKEDFIVSKDGQVFSPKEVIDAMDRITMLGRYQIIQKDKISVNLNIIRDFDISDKTLSEIKNAAEKVFSNKLNVKISEVSSLKKSWHGKIKIVESSI